MYPTSPNLDYYSYFIALGAIFVLWRLHIFVEGRKANPNRLPLPPGPRGYPIIGNLFNFPTTRPWLEYDKWFKFYGDMIYFEVLGQPFLIIGKYEKVYDLCEKRSSNYSDRPRMPMLMVHESWNCSMNSTYNMAFIRYGSWWRRPSHRRAFHQYFHPNIIDNYKSIHQKASRSMTRRLLDTPDDFMLHIQHTFTTSIVKIAYGISLKEKEDPFVKNGHETLAGLSSAGNQGQYMVDMIPIMKYIPDWFPGASFKRKAKRWNYVNGLVMHQPWDHVKDGIKNGTAVPSIATDMIGKLPESGTPEQEEEETVVRNVCAVAYIGGVDTTSSTVQFFMAMALYPEAQKKAQTELDAVLGGRFLEFNDRPNLPYVNALIKESMRWQLVTPLAVGHMCTEADEYDGYYIPKGTVVLGNAWTMLHDPEIFDDPLTFNPDRYLKDGQINPDIRDPNIADFGFGRRICPGRYLSSDSLFSIVTHVLSSFDIQHKLDENGKEIHIEPQMNSGLLSFPMPFTCSTKPRSKAAEELIRTSDLLDSA